MNLKKVKNKKRFKTLGKTQPHFRRIEDFAVNTICTSLLGIVLFLGCCILLISIKAIFYDDWCVKISADGVKNMQLFWQEHSFLLQAFFCSMTLFVACHNLTKYIDVETCRSLSEIRTKLNDEPKKLIHNHILKPDDKKDIKTCLGGYIDGLVSKDGKVDFTTVEIFDYLGTLELGAIMLHRGIITEKEFFDQFGYRYIYIGCSKLMKLIEHDAQYYKPLLYAMEIARKHNNPSGSLVAQLAKQANTKPPCQVDEKKDNNERKDGKKYAKKNRRKKKS